jgi:2,3-bisphosphoglycerate-dependent phosphoglycerate mutase
MVRHAQSEWNREGRFTGWADPPLTGAGRKEAIAAAEKLAQGRYRFDSAYTSRLVRARDTAHFLLRHSGNGDAPVIAEWRLNERHYGALQGKDKAALAARVGEAQVLRWRRGYRDRPPPMDENRLAPDPRWADVDPSRLPNGESLADTRERVMEFWRQEVAPQLRGGRRLLVASHGNTLRGLIMGLQGMSVAEVERFEVPTGLPIEYVFTPDGEPIAWRYLQDDARRAA